MKDHRQGKQDKDQITVDKNADQGGNEKGQHDGSVNDVSAVKLLKLG